MALISCLEATLRSPALLRLWLTHRLKSRRLLIVHLLSLLHLYISLIFINITLLATMQLTIVGITLNSHKPSIVYQVFELRNAHRGACLSTRHRVDLCRVIDSAINVVSTKGQGHLRNAFSVGYPVGLDMWYVVEEYSAHGYSSHILLYRALANLRHAVVATAILQRNKGIKARGLVLKLA